MLPKDKYKVEMLEYRYNSIDVGPGPSIRGNISRMGPALRNYRKTYNLKEAVERFKKLREEFPEDVVIVSKFIDKEYIPGKVIISGRGKPSWQVIDNFYTYKWKRSDARLPFFYLTIDDEPCIPAQKSFFKQEPTFSELMKSGVLAKAFTDKSVLRYMQTSPLLAFPDK